MYESKPSYQAGVVTQTTMRANPDVAFDANPATGYAVYDSFAYDGAAPGWAQIGGTSAGAPSGRPCWRSSTRVAPWRSYRP